jgi:pyruvate dehydrogenase E2 component (dihydrolipoamide acetyltransferase)
MSIIFKMPALSPTMTTGTIVSWHKAEGDEIAIGDVLIEIDTDKATMEVESVHKGILAKILIGGGSHDVNVGVPIALIREKGDTDESIQEELANLESICRGGKQDERKSRPTDKGRTALLDSDYSTKENDQELSSKTRSNPEGRMSATGQSEEAAHHEEDEHINASDRVKLTDQDQQPGERTLASVRDGGPIRPKGERHDKLNNAEKKTQINKREEQELIDSSVTSPLENSSKKASPLARRISETHGVDIKKIRQGTGPGGRIVKDDVLKAIASDNLEDYLIKKEKVYTHSDVLSAEGPEYMDETISRMQQSIAERLGRSWREAPHFYMTISVNASELLRVRAQINDNGAFPIRLTVTDFIIKAAALAMACCPRINVSWNNGMARKYSKSNISVAISTEEGILSPVIYEACSKGICEISRELKDLVSLAKARKIPPGRFDGGALTISNLGMFGIDGFFAIINPPQGTILSVGPARKTPIYDKSGNLIPADIIQLGYSIDHRLINGVDSAQFLERLAKYLENPLSLIVDYAAR